MSKDQDRRTGDLIWIVPSESNPNRIILCLDDENLSDVNIDRSRCRIPAIWLERKMVNLSVDHEELDVVLVDGVRCIVLVGDLVGA